MSFQMRSLVKCLPNNVFLASNPVDVKWGNFSLLRAELSCMRDLLARSGTWKYLINLTGEEFPLVTNLELVTILKRLGGRNIVDGMIHSCNFCNGINNNKPTNVGRTALDRQAEQFNIDGLGLRGFYACSNNSTRGIRTRNLLDNSLPE